MSTPARFYVEPQFCQLYRQKKEQPLSKLLFQGAQWDSSPRLSYFVGCEPVGPIPLDSFGSNEKVGWKVEAPSGEDAGDWMLETGMLSTSSFRID